MNSLCPSCGEETDKSDQFCGSCGAPLLGPHSPKARSNQRSIIIVIAAVLVAAVVTGFAVLMLWPERNLSAARQSSESTTTAEPAPSPTTTQTPTPTDTGKTEQEALEQLGRLRSDSLGQVNLDGRWVAQVASKNVGIHDPLQTTSSGSHTFMAVDILRESEQLAARFEGNPVYVLASTDFGKTSQAPDGTPYWTTVVDSGFSSADEVRTWCATQFSELSPREVENTCAARRLTPPRYS